MCFRKIAPFENSNLRLLCQLFSIVTMQSNTPSPVFSSPVQERVPLPSNGSSDSGSGTTPIRANKYAHWTTNADFYLLNCIRDEGAHVAGYGKSGVLFAKVAAKMNEMKIMSSGCVLSENIVTVRFSTLKSNLKKKLGTDNGRVNLSGFSGDLSDNEKIVRQLIIEHESRTSNDGVASLDRNSSQRMLDQHAVRLVNRTMGGLRTPATQSLEISSESNVIVHDSPNDTRSEDDTSSPEVVLMDDAANKKRRN